MGIFFSRNRADDFDLTVEDLATCEGYVSAEAFRKLEVARAAARSDAGSSMSALARLAARVMDVAAVVLDRAPVSSGTVAAGEAEAPRAAQVPVASPSAPLPTDDRLDEAA